MKQSESIPDAAVTGQLQVAGRFYSWKSDTWEPERPSAKAASYWTGPLSTTKCRFNRRRRSPLPAPGSTLYDGKTLRLDAGETIKLPLRVFNFRGAAWRCPKDANACYVSLAPSTDQNTKPYNVTLDISIAGYEGSECRADAQILPNASIVCAWDKWFDLVLTAAAHAYLDAALKAGLAYMVHDGESAQEDEALLDASDMFDVAVSAICRAHRLQSAEDDCFFARDKRTAAYLERVRLDIVSRLCGESGSVVLP